MQEISGLWVSNVVLRYLNRNERPDFVLNDVRDAGIYPIDAQKEDGASSIYVPMMVIKSLMQGYLWVPRGH